MNPFAKEPAPASRWASAWPDALAFAGGLAVAWFSGWSTTDLVWSLWLSSLVVGYAMILWSIIGPLIQFQREGRAGMVAAGAIGGLFMMAFFTVHFGMFHLGHSLFLNMFFPVGPQTAGLFNFDLYAEVVRRYWYFLPVALLAERQAFRLEPLPSPAAGGAKPAHQARQSPLGGAGVFAPYKNVVRLHLLIFFFAGAHFAKLDGFPVYAVVYAVYFFPWRLLFAGSSKPSAG